MDFKGVLSRMTTQMMWPFLPYKGEEKKKNDNMDFKGVLSRMTTQMMWPFLPYKGEEKKKNYNMDFKGVLLRMTTQIMWPFLNLLSNKILTETILLLFELPELQLSLHLEE